MRWALHLAKILCGAIAISLILTVIRRFTIFSDGFGSNGTHFPIVETNTLKTNDSAAIARSTATWRTGDLIFFNIADNQPFWVKKWERFITYVLHCAYPHAGMVIRDPKTDEIGLLIYGLRTKYNSPSLQNMANVSKQWQCRPLRSFLRVANHVVHMPLRTMYNIEIPDVVKGLEKFGLRGYAYGAYVNYLFLPIVKTSPRDLFCSSGLLYLLVNMGLVDIEKIKQGYHNNNKHLRYLYNCLACDLWRGPIAAEISRLYFSPVQIPIIKN